MTFLGDNLHSGLACSSRKRKSSSSYGNSGFFSSNKLAFLCNKAERFLSLYSTNVRVMAFPVVEFSRQGYKIRKVLG